MAFIAGSIVLSVRRLNILPVCRDLQGLAWFVDFVLHGKLVVYIEVNSDLHGELLEKPYLCQSQCCQHSIGHALLMSLPAC